jgi:hypothetical protein
MFNENQYLLWTNSTRSRYFLIPKTQKLARGRFLIYTLKGTQKKVSQTAISPFEIPESEANQYLQSEINQVMEQAKTTFSNITAFSKQTSEATLSNLQSASDILSLLGVTVEELQSNPKAAEVDFIHIFTELKELLSDSSFQNTAKSEVACARLRSIQETLQAQGININENIEELPDKLQKIFSSLNVDGFLQELGTNLDNIIKENDQQSDTVGQQIDETIKSLNKNFFSEEEKQLEEERKQKYRQSAQDAIAQSLKSRGLR